MVGFRNRAFRVVAINEILVTVTALDSAHTWEMFYSDLQPIPLFPNILSALGFVAAGNGGLYILDGIQWQYRYEEKTNRHECFLIVDVAAGIQKGVVAHFVHEMQNIYRLYLGQELEVRL